MYQVFVSQEFKQSARKAALAIIFFIVSYLLLLATSIGLVIVCAFGGIAIISLGYGGLGIGLALGLMSLGVIIFIFLIKFIFKSNKIDRSHLVELEEADAPRLYQEIRSIVQTVGTNFPKKIYLSPDVNAGVFYDSTFLSMFLPIRKNLQIGLALINSVTEQELKVILAHEFGHFSQKSMKIGSYVYTVNQVIFNMLYDDGDYLHTVRAFGDINGFLALFVKIGEKIMQAIQWILRKLYSVVNLNYLDLSRHMEFHADAIAVGTVGVVPFINFLQRLDLASNSFDNVLVHYQNKITDNIKPTNIFPQHRFVMNCLAKEWGLNFENGLPAVTDEHTQKYNKSKLVVKDQWASHPSINERIKAVIALGKNYVNDNSALATEYFVDIENLQTMITNVLFSDINYKYPVILDEFERFKTDFSSQQKEFNFPAVFQGYYNHHNPVKVELESATNYNKFLKFDELFSSNKVEIIYERLSLIEDITLLYELKNQPSTVKYFEYDGEKYTISDIEKLIPELQKLIEKLDGNILTHDLSIYHYFIDELRGLEQTTNFKASYSAFIEFDKAFDQFEELYNKVTAETQFIQLTTPFTEIEKNLTRFAITEFGLKSKFREVLVSNEYHIKEEQILTLETYLSNDLRYFVNNVYLELNLDVLFKAINTCREIYMDNYILKKRVFLNDFEKLCILRNENVTRVAKLNS